MVASESGLPQVPTLFLFLASNKQWWSRYDDVLSKAFVTGKTTSPTTRHQRRDDITQCFLLRLSSTATTMTIWAELRLSESQKEPNFYLSLSIMSAFHIFGFPMATKKKSSVFSASICSLTLLCSLGATSKNATAENCAFADAQNLVPKYLGGKLRKFICN